MTGLLLLNLGTPAQPTTADVRTYLREFLSNPYVIDINPVGRALLLNLIILPFRPAKSAEAYRLVWTDRGSPLMFHSQDLADKVRTRVNDDWTVALAMRYGEPSIEQGLRALKDAGATRIIAFPLYPQYALSSTTTSEARVREVAAALWDQPELHFVPSFYAEPEFIGAFAGVGAPVLEREQPDHVLFSFHGIPERHVKKTDATGSHCLASADCCDRMTDANRLCYRAHCFATARALADQLGLADDSWSVSFQSRLGRTPWIRPYTDEVVPALAANGVQRLAVFCPAFVADCLETLEEIGMRADKSFRAAGGATLTLVPSLNSTDAWADAVVSLARRAA